MRMRGQATACPRLSPWPKTAGMQIVRLARRPGTIEPMDLGEHEWELWQENGEPIAVRKGKKITCPICVANSNLEA